MDANGAKFLFVNKTSASKHLGRSSGSEKRLILSHVQRDTKDPRRVAIIKRDRVSPRHCTCSALRWYEDGNQARETMPCSSCRSKKRAEGSSSFHVAVGKPQWYEMAFDTESKTCYNLFDRDATAAAFQFFRAKTAFEWSGWSDSAFWQLHAMQLSSSYTPIRHALTALGAFHLSMEQIDQSQAGKCRSLSLCHARHMLRTLLSAQADMPASVLMLSMVVATTVSALLHDSAWLQAAKIEFNLMSKIRERQAHTTDWNFISSFIAPIVEERRSRFSQKIDIIWCLRTAGAEQFYLDSESLPSCFASLSEAQTSLKSLLTQIAYSAKTGTCAAGELPPAAETMMERWYFGWDLLAARGCNQGLNECRLLLLKVSAKFGILMIKTMLIEDETFFDRFEDEYLLLLLTYQKTVHVCKHTRRAPASFAMGPNLLCLISNTLLRWCRYPRIREKLILLLHEDARQEGHDNGTGWARLAQLVQSIEEKGLPNQLATAHDIPASNRIRLDRLTFYKDSLWMQVSFLRYPWCEANRETIWHDWLDLGDDIQLIAGLNKVQSTTNLSPFVILGRGYAQYLNAGTGKVVLDVRNTKFFFPMLRV